MAVGAALSCYRRTWAGPVKQGAVKLNVDVPCLSPEQCDVAVLNGGHGVTSQMLLAGKPVLEIPLAMEQRLLTSAAAWLPPLSSPTRQLT